MKIIVAKGASVRWGVERALQIAESAIKEYKKVFCLGELIHNPQEIERLKSLGMKFIESPEEAEKGSVVLIRSHGVAPFVIERLKEVGVGKIIDATCPLVKEVQKKAVNLEKEGYPVLILGNPEHPEVKGIAGHLSNPMFASSIGEVERFSGEKLVVVCQTTLSFETFLKAKELLSLKVSQLKIYNTICKTTLLRQEEAKKLAKAVDVMLVIGGRNSSNTNKLFRICKSVNENSYLVESEKDLEEKWFDGKEVVGITAGASTPKWIIEKVVNALKGMEEGSGGKRVCETP